MVLIVWVVLISSGLNSGGSLNSEGGLSNGLTSGVVLI